MWRPILSTFQESKGDACGGEPDLEACVAAAEAGELLLQEKHGHKLWCCHAWDFKGMHAVATEYTVGGM